MRRLVALIIVVALAYPSIAVAQAEQSASIDVSKMGVSLDRIRRELTPPASRETVSSNGLKVNFRVDVFGQAPAIELFPKDFSLTYGPVPHSAPTHREHIEFVTPQAFKSPVVPIYGLAVWAAQKLAERSKKSQCEQDIADYRASLMQGIAVTAPRCSQ